MLNWSDHSLFAMKDEEGKHNLLVILRYHITHEPGSKEKVEVRKLWHTVLSHFWHPFPSFLDNRRRCDLPYDQ